MVKVSDVFLAIDRIAPFSNHDKYDNVGLLIGNMDNEVKKALLALDITSAVCDEAIAGGYDLIVTHHPLIFNPLYTLSDKTVEGRLLKNGISHIAAHTNLDMAKGGVSDIMCQLLGFENTGKILEEKSENNGYGKICRCQPMTARELCERVKSAYGNTVVRYVDSKKTIQTVAVCSGGASCNTHIAIALGVDAYITGDVKYSDFVDAERAGLTLIDAGHFHTENICLPYLKSVLEPLVQCDISATGDPLSYVF